MWTRPGQGSGWTPLWSSHICAGFAQDGPFPSLVSQGPAGEGPVAGSRWDQKGDLVDAEPPQGEGRGSCPSGQVGLLGRAGGGFPLMWAARGRLE